MRSLNDALSQCNSYMPGLIDQLNQIPFAERESGKSNQIELFRDSGGAALVIPAEYSGLGAGPAEAAAVQRAIGSIAPSLAVATTMHHFSAATLTALAESPATGGMEWALLEAISVQRRLLASGFAEGRNGQGILSPSMKAVPTDGGYLVSGSKRPCSLTHSMDLLTASVRLPAESGESDGLGVIIVPSTAEGLSRHPFWSSPLLAGAESDELRLDEVFVENDLVVRTDASGGQDADRIQTVAFMWFELLISASYLGMASSLVSQVFSEEIGTQTERFNVGARLETAALLLDSIAGRISAGQSDNGSLAATLLARYGAQDAIFEAAGAAAELLGGMAFIGKRNVSYMASACRCLAFHPPARSATAPSLSAFLAGVEDLVLG